MTQQTGEIQTARDENRRLTDRVTLTDKGYEVDDAKSELGIAGWVDPETHELADDDPFRHNVTFRAPEYAISDTAWGTQYAGYRSAGPGQTPDLVAAGNEFRDEATTDVARRARNEDAAARAVVDATRRLDALPRAADLVRLIAS